jgi:hypothetical protein
MSPLQDSEELVRDPGAALRLPLAIIFHAFSVKTPTYLGGIFLTTRFFTDWMHTNCISRGLAGVNGQTKKSPMIELSSFSFCDRSSGMLRYPGELKR